MPMREWRGTGLRLGVSSVLLLVLLWLVDLGAVGRVLAQVHLGLLVLAFGWLLLERLLHAWRWIVLLRTSMREVPTWFLVRLHLISNFVANFIPFNVGNDATRVVGLARYTGEVADPLSSVIVDRVLGAATLAVAVGIMLIVALLRAPGVVGDAVVVALAGTLAVGGIAVVALWKGNLVDRIAALLRRRFPQRWVENIPMVYQHCLRYGRHPRAVATVVLILTASLGAAILTTWITALALGMEVPLRYFILFVPIISFLSLLPISANGLGVHEGGFVVLFHQVGATHAEALTLALTMRVLIIAATLPGGILLAVERWPKAGPAAEGPNEGTP